MHGPITLDNVQDGSRGQFRTKKAAREAGYRTAKNWQSGWPRLTPRRDAQPVVVKGEAFFSEADCEEILSKTAAIKRGLKIKPDAVAVKTCYSSDYGRYDVYRISDCEVHVKSEVRQEDARRAVETKRQKVDEYVESLVVDVPEIGKNDLIRHACQDYNGRNGSSSGCWASESSDAEFLERICVNYLRHCLTDYEAELEAIVGRVGAREASRNVKVKVLDAIAGQYEWLRDECSRQELRSRLY